MSISLRLLCSLSFCVFSTHLSPWIDNYRIRCVSRLWESLLWWLRLCFCVFFPFLILKPSLRGKESSLSCPHVCKCVYALLSEREREQREPSLQCFLPWPSFWHHLHDDDPSLFLLLLHLYFLSLSHTHFLVYFVCFSLSFIVFLERLILGTREASLLLFLASFPALLLLLWLLPFVSSLGVV